MRTKADTLRFRTASARLLVALAPALFLGGCASVGPDFSSLMERLRPQDGAIQTEETVSPGEAEMALVEDVAVVDRVGLAVDLLHHGQAATARYELKAYLEEEPESEPALYLLSQIETPAPALFPEENFEVKLGKDQSLADLAESYLDNPLGFYGLARYNAIAVPMTVAEGQTIKIPKTPQALAALEARSAQANAVPVPRPAPTTRAAAPNARAGGPTAATPGTATNMRNSPPSARILRGSQTANATPARPRPAVSPEARAAARAEAETHYRNGLAAFQRQDLDGAIAAWDRTLALDPAHKGAQVNRTQALDLKRNLERVREHAQAPALAETQQ